MDDDSRLASCGAAQAFGASPVKRSLGADSRESCKGCAGHPAHGTRHRSGLAIRAGGGNSEITADTNWTSLGTTPNHPEYPAAHGCATGVTSSLVENFFGTRRVRVVVDSTAFSDGVHTHTFFSTADWYHEVYWARIFAGFHFDHSLVDGGAIGRQVAGQLVSKHFRRGQRQGENENHDRK